MMTTATNKITLYNRESGSNKQYTAWLEKKSDGFVVNFQFGPVGGWVKDGTKTKKPVSKDDAQKIYEKLLKSKKAKGYVEGEDAPAFSQTDGDVDSGIRPQLLTPDTEENIEKYVRDPFWGAQEKMNGKRIMIRADAKGVIGVNKRGLVCPIPEELIKALDKSMFEFDGELIGTTYHVFDLTAMGPDLSQNHRETRLEQRHGVAGVAVRNVKSKHVKQVPLVTGEYRKREFVKKLRAGRKEGVVFKKLNAHYEAGRYDNLKKATAVKIKFYKAISVVVNGWNKGKSSVAVGLRDEIKGSKAEIIPVGNVSIPEKYAGKIEEGDVIRVKYLYATSAKKLYQPSLDPADDGAIIADQLMADPITDLQFEGKED
jgi:bifunctional non-homologous end joining protein LigD